MSGATTSQTSMTTGIDLGDRKSHLCVLDADGTIEEESRIATTPKALRARFEGRAATRIALEVGGHSMAVIRRQGSSRRGELGVEGERTSLDHDPRRSDRHPDVPRGRPAGPGARAAR
jgi:hypothetical protein